MSVQKIEDFLYEIKEEGRSSPAGMYWNDFFKFLKSFENSKESNPPVPLILAASGESDTSKHQRLSKQLEWALEHHCLDEAIEFLNKLSRDQWNSGSLENWSKNSYWDLD